MATFQIEEYDAMLASLREKARVASLRADISESFNRQGDLDVVMQACTEAVVKNLNAAFARIWILDKTGRTLNLRASAGLYTHLDGAHGRVRVGDFKIGRIARNRKPHVSNSVTTDPEVSDPEWAKREGMISFAGYPLLLEGKALGVVAFFSRELLSPDVVNELEPIADGIAQWVKRKQAEMAVLEQQEWLNVTLRSIGDAVVTTDTYGSVTFLNPVAEKLTGWTSADALGQPLELVFHVLKEENREPLENSVARTIREKQVVILPTHAILVSKSGEETVIDSRASAIRSEKDEVIGAILVFHDITERRKAERIKDAALQQAQDARREAEILNRVGRKLASELESTKVVQVAVDAGRELTGAQFGTFFYKTNSEEASSFSQQAFSGITPENFAKLGISPSDPLFAGVFAGSDSMRINDMQTTVSSKADKERVASLPWKSFMATPVISRSGSVLGVFFFGHTEAWRFSINFARLIEGMAAQTAIALDNAQLYEALKRGR